MFIHTAIPTICIVVRVYGTCHVSPSACLLVAGRPVVALRGDGLIAAVAVWWLVPSRSLVLLVVRLVALRGDRRIAPWGRLLCRVRLVLGV